MENDEMSEKLLGTDAVHQHFCYVCGHHANSHEIGMNTPQTGRCREQGCDCISLETPDRDMLGEEVERLSTQLATVTSERDALRAVVEHYADENSFSCMCHRVPNYHDNHRNDPCVKDCYWPVSGYGQPVNGYDVARAALAKIREDGECPQT